MYSCLGAECPRIRKFVGELDDSYDPAQVRGLVDDTVAACGQSGSDICAAGGEPRQVVRNMVAKEIATRWVAAQTGGHHSWTQPPLKPVDRPEGEK